MKTLSIYCFFAASIWWTAAPTGDRAVVEKTPGLVAFWTFGEAVGQPRYAVGKMLGEATIGRFGGLAVFNRALTGAEMKLLHDAANLAALK